MTKQREHWGSRLGFLMATAGSAIGLGSLWKFPYIVGENGGGLFVCIYLFFTLLIGIPTFIAELVIGRSAQKSPVGAYFHLSKHNQNWKIVGWIAIITCFVVLSYYSVVAGWSVNYLFMSLVQFSSDKSPQEIKQVFDTLASSWDISLLWHCVFMTLTAGIVYGGIRQGIEYWSKILTPALLVILLILFAYSANLEGFNQAFDFIFRPDFAKFKPSSIIKALSLAFFTLSVGLGIILTYGSYMKKTDDIPQTAFTIALMNIVISLIAALTIFPIIFTFNLRPEEGPGLVFETLPVLFERLPATLVISSIFFLLLVFTALTSSISILEVLTANCIELFEWSRKKATLLIAFAVFIFGIPSALSGSGVLFPNWTKLYGMTFFDTVALISDIWLLPINGLFAACFVGWFFQKETLREEFLKGSTWGWFFRPWLSMVRYLVPLGIALIILQKSQLIDIDTLLGAPKVEKPISKTP